MSELEPPRHVCPPDEVPRNQLVDPHPHVVLGAVRGGGREIELERVAEDGGRLRQRARRRRKLFQLRRDRACDSRWDSEPTCCRRVGAALRHSSEL
ncbi:MAG: hypothetical protein M5U27_15245 [Gaiella sp.]|nr:hypothetical protein [Gaiella sp.]